MKRITATVSLTIRDLRVRAVDIPLDRPIQTASGTVGTSPVVLIDLMTQEGITGSAYIFCYTSLILSPLVRLLFNLAQLLRGTAAEPAAVYQMLDAQFRLLGSSGLIGMAVAGIDMAVWDAVAKAENHPLSHLLGGRDGTIPAYAALRSMDRDGAAREAAKAVEAGFKAVKVKLGYSTLENDLAVVRTLRQSIGDGVTLMADYNQSLTVEEALRRGRALDAEGLAWIEEPVRADDDVGHAQIRAALNTPIQLGENRWGPRDMARSMAASALDYATFDAARIGGISGWLQAASLMEEAGCPVSSHRYPEVSATLLSVTPTSHWLEFVDTVSPVLAHPMQIHDGYAVVPAEPGLGLEWNEAAVDRFLME